MPPSVPSLHPLHLLPAFNNVHHYEQLYHFHLLLNARANANSNSQHARMHRTRVMYDTRADIDEWDISHMSCLTSPSFMRSPPSHAAVLRPRVDDFGDGDAGGRAERD